MNDRRVAALREALELLIDSISATSRLKRWEAADEVPDSLTKSAQLFDKRLEAANKLASSSFVGTPLVVSRLNGISDDIRRLSLAWTHYQGRSDGDPAASASALDTLDAEIDEVSAGIARWS